MDDWISSPKVMDSSTIRSIRLCSIVSCSIGLCALGSVSAQEAARDPAFSVEFDYFSVDAQSNRGEFKGLKISNGEISIGADEATASEVDFQMSEWEMRGNVRIVVGSASIAADRANFVFKDDDLASGELTGTPAALEDFIPAKNETVRATAEKISYDNLAGVARMQGNASLTTGTTQMTGCDIIYDLRDGTMDSGSEQCSEPFRIKFLPREPESTTEDSAPNP